MKSGKLGLGAACAAMVWTGCMVGEPEQAGTGTESKATGQSTMPLGNPEGVVKDGIMLDFDGQEMPIKYRELPDGTLLFGGDIKLHRSEGGKLGLAKTASSLFPTLRKCRTTGSPTSSPPRFRRPRIS